MDNKEYITVAEFANRAKISKQRVYQLLNKRLKPFVQVVDGKKMLNIKGLEDFNIKEDCSNFQESCSSVEQEIKQDKSATLDLLKTTIEILQKQLDEKDKQIQSLTEALRTEQLQTTAAQALHGKNLMLEDTKITDNETVPAEKEYKSIFNRFFRKQK